MSVITRASAARQEAEPGDYSEVGDQLAWDTQRWTTETLFKEERRLGSGPGLAANPCVIITQEPASPDKKRWTIIIKL